MTSRGGGLGGPDGDGEDRIPLASFIPANGLSVCPGRFMGGGGKMPTFVACHNVVYLVEMQYCVDKGKYRNFMT